MSGILEELFTAGGYEPNTGISWDGILQNPLSNSFCPTGKGGGQDPSCSPGTSKERLKSMTSTLSTEGQKAVARNLKQVKEYDDQATLDEAMIKKYGSKPTSDQRQASYSREDGTLHVVKSIPDSVLAHELGHVVDGKSEEVSSRHEFQQAYLKEGHKLSDYATTDRTEAMAEMFRLRHELGPKAVEKLVPKMTKALWVYWKEA